MGTIIVVVLIIVIVVLGFAWRIHDKRSGKGSCCGICDQCHNRCSKK